MSTFLLAFFIFSSYLLGSVCSAILVCRLFHLPDPRVTGSNNPGATNVLRIAGKGFALLVLVSDALKGTLPVLTAKIVGFDDTSMGWIALAAIVGHVYPVFFNFKGGKGVATALGALVGFNVLLSGGVIMTWLIVATITRYSSLASLLALGLMPGYALLYTQLPAELPLCLITLLIWVQHRHNWARLRNGTENRLNF